MSAADWKEEEEEAFVHSPAPGVVGAVAAVGKRALIAGFLGSRDSSFGSSVPMGSGPVATPPGQRNQVPRLLRYQ